MKVFKDIISGDEMFVDTYKIKVVGEVLFEVYGKLIAPNEAIAKMKDFGAAGDPISANYAKLTDNCIDIVFNHRLQECFAFQDKQSFEQYLQQYKKTTLQKLNPVQLHFFVQNIESVLKGILSRFEGLKFFTGESKNLEGLVAMCEYREIDGVKTPVFMFLKHGLKVEKR